MKRCISLLISLITVYGLTLHVEESSWAIQDPQSILYLPMFVILAAALNRIFFDTERRLKIFALIPAVILSICRLFGSLLAEKQTVLWIMKDIRTIIGSVVAFISAAVLLFCIIFFCYRLLRGKRPSSTSLSRIPFLIIWLIMAIAWLPWLLTQYPGVMTADTTDTIEMALGIEPLTNHHPVFYTYLIKGALKLGNLISGPDAGNQTGIAIFTIMQFLCISAVCAGVLHLILKNTSSKAAGIGAFLFFVFYPVHPLYSVTIWKDVPFSICVLLLTVFLYLELNKHQVRYCAGILLCGILLSLFRHNGIYLIILTIPFLPAAFKRSGKQVCAAFLFILLLFIGWRGLLSIRQIPDGRKSEAFSIPLQLTALTAKRQHASMDESLLSELNEWFTQPEIWERYSWRISDPVKNLFNEDLYKADPARFWKFWLKLGELYPQDYLDGLLLHTYGYWYPETRHWVFITGIDDNEAFGIHMDPKLNTAAANTVIQWFTGCGYDRIPLVSLLFSPGACFWILLVSFFFCLYRKSPIFILFIPSFILWLTALASPVNCEFRYVYGMFTCIPLILSSIPLGEKAD